MLIRPRTRESGIDDEHGREQRPDGGGAPPLDREQARRIAMAIGITQGSKPASISTIPSTAESTEMAGVIIVSP
jgi:hypothetical protein